MNSPPEKSDFMAIFNLEFYKKRSSWKLAEKVAKLTLPEHPKQLEEQNNNNESQDGPTSQHHRNKDAKYKNNLNSEFEDDPEPEMVVAPDDNDDDDSDDDGAGLGEADDDGGMDACDEPDPSLSLDEHVRETTPQHHTDENITEVSRGCRETEVPAMVQLEMDWAAEVADMPFDHVDEPPSWMRDYRQIEDLAESVENCARLSDVIEDDTENIEDSSERLAELSDGAHTAPSSPGQEPRASAPVDCSWCPTAINEDTIANLTGAELSLRVHVYARTLAALLRETAFRTKIKMYEDLEPVLAQFPACPTGRGRGRLHRDAS